MTLDLVAALAGDRPIAETEKQFVDSVRELRGQSFYADVLRVVTHREFPFSDAARTWNHILEHKCDMSSRLGRNVRIVVASLDYLANLTGELQSATVIDEAHVADLLRLSQHDGLTGLFNHAYFYHRLDAEMQRYIRYGTVVSLMMADIDDFKTVNDLYGHIEGDRVLAAMGELIRGSVRESDICCRYSGEKFAVILPATTISMASALAQRLRAAIAAAIPAGRSITVSIGVASGRPEAVIAHALVRRVDTALYQAKRNGKNRIVTIE